MQMHSFLKSSCFPGVWKRKPFSTCLLQHTKAHFGWVQGRLNAYDSCRFCFYFHKFIYLFCLSTHHLSTFLKANQFGLIWSELHRWVQPCLKPFEACILVLKIMSSLSLWAFFPFGCEPIDFVHAAALICYFFWGLGLSSKYHGSNLCSSQPIGLLHFIGSSSKVALKCSLIFLFSYRVWNGSSRGCSSQECNKPQAPHTESFHYFHYVVMDYGTGESSLVTRK